MALSTLFDDFPVFDFGNGTPRRRRPRPLLYSVLDSLEDQIGQKVGQVFRLLPALTLDLDDYEHGLPGKKRKLRPGALTTYEPKSKVVVSNKDNKFKICLDTSNYQPEEITVKVVNDKIAISAKHEAKEKDVYEFYEMYRSFDLPENVVAAAITSHLSAAGQLTIEAPLKALPESNERTIPVTIENKDKEPAAAVVEASKTPEDSKTTEKIEE